MIKGMGIDLIEVKRIQKMLAQDERFCQKVFSVDEINYCESMRYRERHYAARFAAKEAFFKALGTGLRAGLSWLDVSIDHDKLKKPFIRLTGEAKEIFQSQGWQSLHLTLTHTDKYAAAIVIVE